ncbi:unnamed protein product [Tuber aestivum]|uniref:Uncharacterized protein n=1 Tax=Tuber aestivum TaxID=59557 RepID=A0A292Q456_9PEZI|nr:unnamed protein product [Tuber aestivum]
MKCMSTVTHDSPQYFFTHTVCVSLTEKVGLLKARQLVSVGSGTTFIGFEGGRSGSSEKLPDTFVRLRGARFPAVVCEAGWSETREQLIDDGRLWLLHTGGEPKIVIVVSFTETPTRDGMEVVPINVRNWDPEWQKANQGAKDHCKYRHINRPYRFSSKITRPQSESYVTEAFN